MCEYNELCTQVVTAKNAKITTYHVWNTNIAELATLSTKIDAANATSLRLQRAIDLCRSEKVHRISSMKEIECSICSALNTEYIENATALRNYTTMITTVKQRIADAKTAYDTANDTYRDILEEWHAYSSYAILQQLQQTATLLITDTDTDTDTDTKVTDIGKSMPLVTTLEEVPAAAIAISTVVADAITTDLKQQVLQAEYQCTGLRKLNRKLLDLIEKQMDVLKIYGANTIKFVRM
jgi:Na+-translocating ferredoxin:NAD+ oxidoreductase RnfC subunit